MNVTPCNKIILSASHNKFETREEADKRILEKANQDKEAGKSCISYNFIRAKDDEIDENKFLMPIYGTMPVIAFQLTYCGSLGLETAVIGSKEVGRVVEAVKEGLNLDERIKWVDEGEQLSIKNSISKGYESLEVKANETLGFFAGDVPFAFDFLHSLYDKDLENNVAVIDFNSKQQMFKEEAFIPRNYYQILTDGINEHEIKEPNLWWFSNEAINNFISAGGEAYKNRQNGGMTLKQTLFMCGKRLLKDLPRMPWPVVGDLISTSNIALKRIFGSNERLKGTYRLAEHLGTYVFEGPVKVKTEHDDPWRMKDIDARHDLWYYNKLVREAMYHKKTDSFSGLEYINPFAKEIGKLEGIMKEVSQEIPILGNFAEEENKRSVYLKMKHPPFNKDGQFMGKIDPAENTTKGIHDLVDRTIRFKHKQETYRKAIKQA